MAKKAQAIVYGNDYRGAAVWPAGGELTSVVIVGFTVNISATVNPDQNRFVAASCREDVEIEAVLGDARWSGKRTEFSYRGQVLANSVASSRA